MQLVQNDFAGALTSYRVSLEIRERLARSDPGNAIRRFDLGPSNEKIGNVQRAQGDLVGAQASYSAKFEIIDRLTRADPDNVHFQRDLSVAYTRSSATCNSPSTSRLRRSVSFRESFAIIERLIRVRSGQRRMAAPRRRVAWKDRNGAQGNGKSRRGVGSATAGPHDHGPARPPCHRTMSSGSGILMSSRAE